MTAIEWTDETWNPMAGCTIVSEGCRNCYAMRMAARLEAMGQEKYAGLTTRRNGSAVWNGEINEDFAVVRQPLRWRRPRRVFVNSMSDLFHERASDALIEAVWRTMRATPRHTYQILTKRPKRMREAARRLNVGDNGMPLPNVWLGVSIEDTVSAEERIPNLEHTFARVRFLSIEPLLGPLIGVDLGCADWVIVGGESGPGARPMDPDWVRVIRNVCNAVGTPFFFKQWGGRTPKANGRELDGRTWDEYPEEVQG